MTETADRLYVDGRNTARRILAPETFFYFLELEVKRARRYQDFFSLLILTIRRFPGARDGNGFEKFHEKLIRVLGEELRESDVVGSFGPDKMGVLLPHAEQSDAVRVRCRFEKNLKNEHFENEGNEIRIDQISFPLDGTDTAGLLKRVTGEEPWHALSAT